MTQRKLQKIGTPRLCEDCDRPVSPRVLLSPHPPKAHRLAGTPKTETGECSGEVGNLEGGEEQSGVAEAAQPRPSVRSAMSRMSQKWTRLELPLLARSGHSLKHPRQLSAGSS